MHRWIALFRGINVGGKNKLPMNLLKQILGELNCTNVQTYIQSGNVVFESRSGHAGRLSERIATAVNQQVGFRPAVMLLTAQQWIDAVRANPFPAASVDPKSVHFFFLQTPAAKADLEKLNQNCCDTERFELTDSVFYLLAPDGIARSKLAGSCERWLGVTATARNYRTVQKILELVTAG